MEERAPDCTTARAASIAGILSAAVMANEMSLMDGVLPEAVNATLGSLLAADPLLDLPSYAADMREGVRVAYLMISARARASVRTPSHAAVSGAEAALALAEDALADAPEGAELPDAHAVLASIRDALRAGLAPLHAAEGSGPAAA